jgi:hypothetical protein
MYYWTVFTFFNLLICLVCFYCEGLNYAYMVTRRDSTQHMNIHALNGARIHYIHNTAFTIAIRFSLKCHRIKTNNFRIFVSFFLIMTSVYLLIAGVEGYCCTWSHSMTHKLARSVGLLWTSDRQVTQTSTWQHTILTITRNRCKRAAAVLRRRTFESKNCINYEISRYRVQHIHFLPFSYCFYIKPDNDSCIRSKHVAA